MAEGNKSTRVLPDGKQTSDDQKPSQVKAVTEHKYSVAVVALTVEK